MRKGFALITILAVLIMVALGTATILQSVGSQTSMKSNNVRDVQTQYLTEAGMQYALYRCRTNAAGCPGGVATCCIAEILPAATTGLGADIAITLPGPGEIKVDIVYADV